jgi:ubiquinol oxidase
MPTSNSSAPHREPKDLSDRFAYAFTKLLRFFADTFFARRYGHRAVVLETVAAVPGMVGGALQHLRALRRMESDGGWIRTLLEEAVYSYTEYLAAIDDGTIANVAAPRIAIDYWKLAPDARLRDVVLAIRADEGHHRDVNHGFADALA